MRILYVVSTLRRSGPINVLFNILAHLDPSIEKLVVTLSPEGKDSLWDKFAATGINLDSLGQGRIRGIFYGKKKLKALIKDYKPDVIHSHGFRPDSVVASLGVKSRWVATAHNYPYEDYLMKFGRFRGNLMARSHIGNMRKTDHLVACSKTIADKLAAHSLKAKAIQNGVKLLSKTRSGTTPGELDELSKPIFISVGSLIPLKNMELLVKAFCSKNTELQGSLVILGDGPDRERLMELSRGNNILLAGYRDNVTDYLESADYYVSASLSEGLPNSVLEALGAGLPCLLSNIPSHEEIQREGSRCVHIFNLEDGAEGLADKFSTCHSLFDNSCHLEAQSLVRGKFSAENMSHQYQCLYNEIFSSARV